jgi:hypothetical protein
VRPIAGGLVGEAFAFDSPQFLAVTKENLNQIFLRLNGGVLLNDEQSHETVGK